jgi:hypothetical protein
MEAHMDKPLFLSSDEMNRLLTAAKKRRSDYLHSLALGARDKLAAHTRHVRTFGAATVFGLACALPLGLGAFYSPGGQSNVSDEHWRADVTVVTIAPDGTWGTATDALTNRAAAKAIEDCKQKYMSAIGCGYRSTFVRQGWSLVFRCGTENILVAEKELADAQWAAFRQERDLRARYVPNMPACERTLTVDPQGEIVPPKTDYFSTF